MAKPKAKSETTPNGRPPKFADPAEFFAEIKAYIDNCTATSTMPNKAGICIWLQMSRDTYNKYKKKRGFADAIKGAEEWIENAWVQRLAGANATGSIFYLKAAMGWKDQQAVDLTSGGKPLSILFDTSFNEAAR